MSSATKANIQRALNNNGIPFEFVRGDGYCYFIYDARSDPQRLYSPVGFDTRSVWVPYANSLPVTQWMKCAEEFAADLKRRADQILLLERLNKEESE